MTEKLAESQRRERNFLMVVSHELRTPLTAIRGHVEALREGIAQDEETREASLRVIGAETDRLTRLVGDVLDLARMEAHRFTLEEEEVELRRLLEQAYESFGEEARRRGIEYECSLEADPVLDTDGDRVLQIVSNLLDNAFAWTPDGGRIDLGLSATNGTISISVAHSGPGIGQGGARADLSARSGRGPGKGRASGFRSRASSRRRSEASSCSSRNSGRGPASNSATGRARPSTSSGWSSPTR